MRLTDTGIIKNDNIFNGFDIRPYPIDIGETQSDCDNEYLILCIRSKCDARITRTLALKIEHNGSGLDKCAFDSHTLGEAYKKAKKNTNNVPARYKYRYFSHIANEYLRMLSNYFADGDNGFDIYEWECVGGRCRIVDTKKYVHAFIRHLVVKKVEEDIEECLKNEIKKLLNQ